MRVKSRDHREQKRRAEIETELNGGIGVEATAEKSVRAVREWGPWFTMWLYPRQTMRYILETDLKKNVFLLAVIGGMISMLNRVSANGMEVRESPETIFLLCVIGGPIVGLFSVYGVGALFTMIGRWVGGTGSYEEVRTALGWAQVPIVWSGLLWAAEYLMFGKDFFTPKFPGNRDMFTVEAAGYLMILADTAVGIWSIVVLVNCLAEAHRMPLLKAFWSCLILLGGFAVLLAVTACVI
jgi:hypothetical protein